MNSEMIHQDSVLSPLRRISLSW